MENEKKNEIVENEEVVIESTESQIIETGFIAQEKTKEKIAPQPQPKGFRHKKNKAFDVDHIKIMVGFLVATIFAFLAYSNLDTIEKNYIQTQQVAVNNKTKEIASRVEQKIKAFQNKFAKLQLKKIEGNESIKSNDLFLDSTISYLALPLNHTKIVDDPTLGYAFLDLLDKLFSQTNQQVSPIEIIKPNSEHTSIVVVKKATESDLENVIGFYICSLPKMFTHQLVQEFDVEGASINLFQGRGKIIKIASKGPHIQSGINQYSPVNNGLWSLNYTRTVKITDTNPSSYILFIIYALITLILIAYALFTAIKKVKEFKNATHKEAASSILENKQSISNLGMKKNTALADITKTSDKIKSDEQTPASVDSIDPAIFNDYGIRGIFGAQINAPIFTYLAHGIAQEMESRDISMLAIGYDGRTSSEALYQALLQGFAAYKITIIDLGLVTLPVLYYCAQNQSQGNAVMVTAGSSPAEYNGLKILLNNEMLTQSKLKSLIDITPEKGDQLATFEKNNLNHSYINSISENFNLAKSLTIVVDFANGVSSQIVFDLLKILGCKIIPLFEELNGNFPNHSPNPSKTENLQALSEKVKTESADIGITFNGDGSALGVVASNGDIIWSDRVLMLLAKDVLQQSSDAQVMGAKIMYDVKSSSGLHEWIISHKGEPEITPSGYTNIIPRMRANKALLAGEFSGHLFFTEHLNGLDDAFFAAAKILQSVSSYPGKSADLFKSIPEKISTPEILIGVQHGQQEHIMKKILSQKEEFMPAGLITLDGLRVEYEDGWGVVRLSKTSASLSLRFEAENSQALQRIAEKFKEVVLSVVFVKFPY